MPKIETVIRVFVASPSDVDDERQRIREVIAEVNNTLGSIYAIRLELVMWEKSTHPSMGEDAQDVINRQIADDYDVFVGIMWSRFGTETGRHGSGTEEEFERAYNRYTERKDILEIMFYFKDEPIAPSKLDPVQLGKVLAFRDRIRTRGAYTWSFAVGSEFESAFRVHMMKVVSNYAQGHSSVGPAATKTGSVESGSPDQEVEEIGLLEVAETMEHELARVTQVVNKIEFHTNLITEKLNARTLDTQRLMASTFGMPKRADAASVINLAADDLYEFASNLEAESDQFSESIASSHKSLIQLLYFMKETAGEDRSQYQQTLSAAVELRIVIAGASTQLSSFSKTVEGIPRMTTKLNTAKRRVVTVLAKIRDALDQSVRLIDEALMEIGK